MIRIAIDGPGGAGKSSVAKRVAKELGIIYVDTGALYRNIGLFVLNKGIDPKDSEGVIGALSEISLELKFSDGKQIILLNGEDMGDKIRTPEVSMAASAVSAIPAVREFLLNTQRDTAKKNSVIMDGRDIGTVILPDAEVKIFLTASPEARAKRRFAELRARGNNDITYEQVFCEMAERDKNDSTRAVAPCVQAKDALLLDNSDLTEEQTCEEVLKIVKKKSTPQKNRLYSFLKPIVGPIYRFFVRVKGVGVENIPDEGGLVLCSNHIAALDVITIGCVSKRQLCFVAKKELFSVPILKGLIKALGAIKMDRSGGNVGAIKASVETAKSGKILSIFPQGHRFPGVDPAKTPIRHGAGLIAYQSGCDVLPVCIKIKGCKYRFLRKTEVVFGKVIKNSELGFVNGGTAEYKAATELIFSKITELGDYSDLPAPKNEKRGKKS